MQSKQLTRRFLDNAVWSIGNKLGIYALRIGVTAVTARFIEPKAFGEFAALLAIASFGQIVASSTTSLVLVQRKEVSDRDWRAGLTLNLCGALLIALAYAFGAALIAKAMNMPLIEKWIPFLGILVISEACASVFRASIEREMRVKQSVIVDGIAFVISQVVILIPLAVYVGGVLSLMVAFFSQTLLMLAGVAFLRARFSLLPNFGAEFRELAGLAMTLRYATIANFFAREGDNLVVGRVLGATALGFYSRAYNLMSMPAQFLGDALQRALLPFLCRRSEISRDTDRIFLQILELLGFGSLAATALVVVQADWIVAVLLGPEWGEVVPLLQALALGTFLRVGHKVLDSTVASTGALRIQSFAHLAYSIAVISAVWVGCRFGVVGAAFGTLFALTVHYTILMAIAVRKLHISLFRILVLHALGAGFLVFLTAIQWGARHVVLQLHWPPIAGLAAAGLVLLISCSAVAWVLFYGKVPLANREWIAGFLQRRATKH